MGPTAQIAVYYEKSVIWGLLRRLRSIMKRAAYGAHCADCGLFLRNKSGIWGPLSRLQSILAEQERHMGPTEQIAVYFEKSGKWGPLRRWRSILAEQERHMGPTAQIAIYSCGTRAAYGAHCADCGLLLRNKSGIWGPLRRLRSILAEQERHMGPTAQIAVYSCGTRAAYGAH